MCPGVLNNSQGAVLQTKPYCTRSLAAHTDPVHVVRAVLLCLRSCCGASARVLPLTLSPECVGMAPPSYGAKDSGGPQVPGTFLYSLPSALLLLSSLGFLLSCFKDFIFISPGHADCGSQYFWPAHICPVLTGEARQGKARK